MITNNTSTQTTFPNRIAYFDILKGIAIFLVVLGHCLQIFTPNWQENKIALSIYMFHMPLFIFISGYFFYPSVKKIPLKEFIVKKFIRLYLPSLFWGLFNTPIRDKIAISCMLRQIHESSSHAIRHGLYIKNRKRLFCP